MKTFFLYLCVLFLFLTTSTNTALAQSTIYTPPSLSVNALKNIQFSQAVPFNEEYRKQFELCDKENTFNGETMKGFRKCSGDPNNVKALLKFPDETIFFESKLSLDIDGSWKACNDPGLVDLCPTSYSWKGLSGNNKFVDSDKFPFIVIPATSPEFRNKTGITMGDLGVVVYKDKVIPIFVADGGPFNKLGEGSSALFRELGEDRCTKRNTDGNCINFRNTSIVGKVLFFVFPKSKISDLSPDNAINKIKSEALSRFQKLKKVSKSVLKVNQPNVGQVVSINEPIKFFGTAEPEVSRILVKIGPNGPFTIADLKDVKGIWEFTVTFRNSGNSRPIVFSSFDSSGSSLGDVTSSITVK